MTEQRAYCTWEPRQTRVETSERICGYGIASGPHSDKAKNKHWFCELITKNPRNYIAQPTLKLSTATNTYIKRSLEPRHLGPFVHSYCKPKITYVTTGGLTALGAMKKGSLSLIRHSGV